MVHDLLQTTPQPDARRDVCVIGAGAAGIALAVELERLGKSVFLLEGGGPQIEELAQEPYGSQVVGLAHRGVHVGRFRAKGGTTTQWGGQILELNLIDFERRPWIPGSGWPFSKQHLAPYYAHALRIEGIEAAIGHDPDIWKRLGIPMPGFPGMESYVSRWLPEPNFARVHRKSLEGAAIDLWLHANAVELILEDDAVRGVLCRTQATPGQPPREALFQAREYVFCLGAIESSRFFLQPRRSGGALPWNVSGMLGKHFQDHLDSNAATVKPKSLRKLHQAFDNIFLDGFKYHPKIRLEPQLQQKSQVLNAGASMYFVSDIDEALAANKKTVRHLLRGRLGEVRGQDALDLVRNSPLLALQGFRYAVQHRAYVPLTAKIMLRVHCEQEPDSASSVSLADERDSLGLLRTRLDWKISTLELRTIRQFVELASQALSALAEIEPVPELADDDAYRALCDDSNHHMGGMRMDDSPARGVVDADLKLNGTRNCYVCSSAVFPSSGFSNPTHTLLALTVRLAQHLNRSVAPDTAAPDSTHAPQTMGS